ncbi:rod shape-determining protein MreD [Allopontixanthobacter sp.]|uniref:rod shape-determining protein MreD n=1 Tax=Allopontixanthobacter sp. TaxID=2906452 RepID=UPI002ABCEE3E|nr:rod shape-determining protein MreD [Allopontixanthobacter sp.]MDZ4307327.1 rod shape-determining protein MreD [Allopontixanthobacter sp.]
MRTAYRGTVRRDEFGSRINRRHSAVLAYGIPVASILVGSILPLLFIASAVPLVPPMGFMFLLGWRLVRPGIVPVWAGFPLGIWDDLFSGFPFGSAILLWSMTLIAIDALEVRFPWHGFIQDWMTAGLILTVYLLVATLLSGAHGSFPMLLALVPQLLLSVLLFPIISRMIASLDRLRLTRFRKS